MTEIQIKVEIIDKKIIELKKERANILMDELLNISKEKEIPIEFMQFQEDYNCDEKSNKLGFCCYDSRDPKEMCLYCKSITEGV